MTTTLTPALISKALDRNISELEYGLLWEAFNTRQVIRFDGWNIQHVGEDGLGFDVWKTDAEIHTFVTLDQMVDFLRRYAADMADFNEWVDLQYELRKDA